MGLSVEVGMLAALVQIDPDGVGWLRESFESLNQVLADHGLPPHCEPESLPSLDNRASLLSYPYRFLHHLRRIAAHAGVLLTNLAEQFEQSHGLNDPAGGYGGLIPAFFRYGPLDQYFLGISVPIFFENTPRRIYVLGCDCGEVGCWPLSCLVDAQDATVSWQRFEHDHRPNRDYSEFGPFVFDRRQYESALRGLPSETSAA